MLMARADGGSRPGAMLPASHRQNAHHCSTALFHPSRRNEAAPQHSRPRRRQWCSCRGNRLNKKARTDGHASGCRGRAGVSEGVGIPLQDLGFVAVHRARRTQHAQRRRTHSSVWPSSRPKDGQRPQLRRAGAPTYTCSQRKSLGHHTGSSSSQTTRKLTSQTPCHQG